MRIGFWGAGKMAEGILSAIYDKSGVLMAELLEPRRRELEEKYGVATTGDVAEVAKEALLDALVEGETVNGTVTRVMDFGAFVDLGGAEGLIPAREVAWERVPDLNTVLRAGDGVTVKVLRVDREAGRITLSRKECVQRVFHKTAEEIAAEENAAEVAAWMAAAEKKNANVGSLADAFGKLGL